ncbi:nucleotidyltransferase family protein [Vibrio mediterranei]
MKVHYLEKAVVTRQTSEPCTEHICDYVVEYLCQKYGYILEVYLYGSRASGNYTPESDHDFYFVYQTGKECGLDFKHHDFLKHITELRTDARRHFGAKVDIDVMGCSQTTFEELKSDSDCHAGAANIKGRLLFSSCNNKSARVISNLA